MHELKQLKTMLMKELEEYGKRSELSAGSLETIDTLAHAIKNLCKVIESMEEYSEEGNSSYYRRGSYDGSSRGGSYDGSYEGMGGSSERRGRYRAARDSRGRYMSDGNYYEAQEDAMKTLRELMDNEQDETNRQEIQKFMTKLERLSK